LHDPAFKGHKDVVELPLANGADVNAKTGRGLTPLRHAAFKGHKDVVELLLANGPDVNLPRPTEEAERLCMRRRRKATRIWRNCCASAAATNKLLSL
jgi:hypothetical protein